MSLVMSCEMESRACRTLSWRDLAEQVLDGHQITFDEGLAIVRCSDDEVLDLL